MGGAREAQRARPGLLNRMSDYGNLVPPKYYASISQQDAAVKPVGSGPYKLVRWTQGVEMVFEANPDYWNKKLVLTKTIRVVPIREDGTKVAALLSGEVNFAADIPPQYIPRLKKDPRTTVAVEKGTRIYHLGFTHDINSPMSDVRVRRAIAYAIDRNVLVKDVVEGYGAVANSPLHEWTEGHDANLKWPYPYNPAKAKELLKEAGYPNGFDIDFYSPAGRYTKDKEVAEAISGSCRMWACGELSPTDLEPFRRGVPRQEQARDQAVPLLYRLRQRQRRYGQHAERHRRLQGRVERLRNPALDKLMDKALSNPDLKARDAIFKEIVNKMVADVSHVFLWQEDALYGMTSDIQWDVRNDDRVYAWEIHRK